MTDVGAAPRALKRELIMLVPGNDGALPSIINTSAAECEKAETPLQSAAFYLSVIAGLFPQLLPLAKSELQQKGYTVREVTEETAAENLITLRNGIDFPTLTSIFAQFALLIYKKYDHRSYPESLQRRMAAINSIAFNGEVDVLLSISTVKNIWNIVGRSNKIRAALLGVILANRDHGNGVLSSQCRYLAMIISWTGMVNSPQKLVYETLCKHDQSPVLKDVRVRHEVEHLERFIEEPYPEYYHILHPTEPVVASRFKTLTEVAMRYNTEVQNNTISRFAASFSEAQKTVVGNLVSIHYAHTRRIDEEVIGFLFADYQFED